MMKTISKSIKNELIIKNSKFITILFKLTSNNVEDLLKEIKQTYPKATHYCYAYIYKEEKKSSDDGEPGGTAGMPILNVLEKENLTNVLAVVVRYFGGIKLGAGGLVRAYTKSITETLKQSNYLELIEGYKIEITISYQEEKQLLYILKNASIIKKDYQETITYQVLISKEDINLLHNYNYKIIESTYIEKKSS